MKEFLLSLSLLLVSTAFADNNTNCSNSQDCYNSGVYVYEDGQDLIDLYNMSGTTNLNSSDDSWSNQVSLGMEWDRWGQTWSHARMSTNGCVNLTSGSAGGTSSNCQDYTPQSLPYRDYTLYAFWTDLIRKNSSKMLYKDFGDYVVFGWYYMKEYNRSSSNSIEAILYANNSYEYRYRELDIINHDVVIGEQGKHSTHPEYTKTYLYYNDGQSGYATLDAYLANSGWPDLENGGSLYSGSFESMCEVNQLYSSNCSGYAAAYLAQQCALDTLYNSACTGYAAAYLAQQCALNTLYDEDCTGYAVAYLAQQCGLNTLYDEECTGYAVAYFIYECDIDVFYSTSCDGYASALAQEEALNAAIYGTDDDLYGYDNGYDEYGYDEYGDDYYDDDPYANMEFTDEEWYEIDLEEFGQAQVDEWYGTDLEFSDDGYIDYGAQTEDEYWTNIDEGMDEYDAEQEALWAIEEAWYAEEDARMLAEAEMYAAEEQAYQEEVYEEEYLTEYYEEEAYQEEFLTDAEWYEIDIEEFGQEQVNEWYGEEVSFDEEGFIPETYWEDLYEEDLVAQNITDQELYILEEEIGVEIFVEEEWEPTEDNEIYEEVLEDFEREVLEEHEEEVFEEFEEEYDEEELFIEEDEAFEDLIDEEELEELINEEKQEEFFKEEVEDEDEERPIRSSGVEQGSSETKTEQTFTVMIAQQEQKQEQVIQQAVSQDSTSSSQAAVAEIDFGGTQEEQQTVAEVVQEQLDDSSSGGSSTGGSFDTNSFSTGSSSSGGGQVVSASQQEQVTQATGDTFVMEQQEQSTGQVQTALQVTEVFDSGPEVSAFEMAEEQSATEELTFDDGSSFTVAGQNFETSFDDALGAGQSIGQFLSNQQPTFARFDIGPPTQSEQKTTEAVESLADRVGTQQAQANLQAQFEQIQQGGGFDEDQTATVAFLGYKSGFSDYTGQAQLTDQEDWYMSKTMYRDKKIDDNKFSFYMMAGKTQQKLQEMIRSQYERGE